MIRLRACWVVHAPVWVQSHSEDADAPRRVLYYGQDIGLGAAGQVGQLAVDPAVPPFRVLLG